MSDYYLGGREPAYNWVLFALSVCLVVATEFLGKVRAACSVAGITHLRSCLFVCIAWCALAVGCTPDQNPFIVFWITFSGWPIIVFCYCLRWYLRGSRNEWSRKQKVRLIGPIRYYLSMITTEKEAAEILESKHESTPQKTIGNEIGKRNRLSLIVTVPQPSIPILITPETTEPVKTSSPTHNNRNPPRSSSQDIEEEPELKSQSKKPNKLKKKKKELPHHIELSNMNELSTIEETEGGYRVEDTEDPTTMKKEKEDCRVCAIPTSETQCLIM